MKLTKLMIIYLSLIILHILHLLEEIFGMASFIITSYKNTYLFLFINIILLIIPISLIYAFSKKKKWAYLISYGYSLLMIIDGIEHLITQEAGIYTGIGLIIFSFLLIIYLTKEIKNRKI
ncbi:hypothetical protein HYW75_07040 [Candidatus Pacearchaeota archaeon]|nr:hypothetical protein [Candidatus Pacearchaeota archaeon]